jgi:methenyltetrahydrofolate cyclohydrolase
MDPSSDNTTPDYLDLPLWEFLELVASDSPAPGGGSVAAVAVALAAGLAGMAARLSTGRMADAAKLADHADASRRRVAPLARADAESYGRVLDALRLPRDAETRTERVKDALSGAADVPLAVAEAGSEIAGIAARLVEEGNPNLKGDAMTAVFLADAGVNASAALAEINLSSANVQDDRLGRAQELVDLTAAAVRRAAEDPGRG